MNTELLYQPLPEQDTLGAGIDYYKPTMSQVHYEQHPDVEVTFTFKNRGQERLADHINPDILQARLDALRAQNWTEQELDYFAGLKAQSGEPMFTEDFIDYLATNQLPPVEVQLDPETDDLDIITTGAAPLVTFWETIVMGNVNEMYFEGYVAANGIDSNALYEEGDRRLTDKITILQQNPDILFSEFGNRRHFSYRWHNYVLERLAKECPQNLIGTSNIALARVKELKPIGTHAHEMPMIYAGIADANDEPIRASHHQFFTDWYEKYGGDLDIALTDTFGTDFFFTDFTPEQAEQWKMLRHDSGDPFLFGERVIEFYEKQAIDPRTKTIVFSDGLDINTIVALHEHFKDRIGEVYGWGTTLTNDLGLKPLNIVMKATHVRLPNGKEADLVKLSDNVGKHTGPEALIMRYMIEFAPQYAKAEGVLPC